MCLYFHRKHSCWIRCMDSDREIERCSILLSSSETEGFRKQSYPRPPTITGLTPPDPHITAPPPIYTYAVHTRQTFKESMAQRDPAWWRGWGININTNVAATDIGDPEVWGPARPVANGVPRLLQGGQHSEVTV